MKRYYLYLFVIIVVLLSDAAIAQTYLFIGSYNFNRNKQGIYVYRFDTATGAMEYVSSTRQIPNPSYVTLSPNGKHLYACTETLTPKGGAVSSFSFDSRSGKLTYLGSQKSWGENPVYVTVDKNEKWLINANYTEGGIAVYPLDSNGIIGEARQKMSFFEGSVNPRKQERAHVHCAVFTPAQDYILFPDLGADKIRYYSFDPLKTEPLSATSDSFMRTIPGSGPRHLTFHPNGKYAYCNEELSGYVSAYNYKNGTLDSFQRIATHEVEHDKDYSNADIHVAPDGRFLYASNRGTQNNIAIFSISAYNGGLRLLGYQSVSGNHPRNFTIDPTGNFLIVANQVSGNVVVFRRDVKTGMLTKTKHHVRILNPSCVQTRTY